MTEFYGIRIQSWHRDWYDTNASKILDLILNEISSTLDAEIKVIGTEEDIIPASEYRPMARTLTCYLASEKNFGFDIKRIALRHEEGRLEGCTRLCDIDVVEYEEKEIRIEDLPEFKILSRAKRREIEKEVLQELNK